MSVYKVCWILLSVCLQTVVSGDTQTSNDNYDKRLSVVEDVVRLQGIRLREQDMHIQQLTDINTRLNTENDKLIKKLVRLEDIVSIQGTQYGRLLKRFETLEENTTEFGKGRQSLNNKKITNIGHGDLNRLTNETKDEKMESNVDRNSEHGKRMIIREHIPSDINGKPVVAFYAYMNTDEAYPSKHHTLLFDIVKTNLGNAYNRYSGYFTAPVTGVYVFSYSVRVYCQKYIGVQLVKNSDVEGAIIADSRYVCNNDSASETMVIEVDSGDVVFVRTHESLTPGGDIQSDNVGRVYFSGWLIG